jgi:hypothetical protein
VMPKDKPGELQPEEALQLQEEIEAYLRWWSLPESETGKPMRFEERLERALRERDPKFFEKMAALCRIESQQWYFLQPNEQGVRWIAVIARIWLERARQTVTRANLRTLTENIWAARFAGYEPGYVEIVETYEIEVDEEHKRLFAPGDGPVIGQIRRYPGTWSALDYITAFEHDSEIPEKLREKIEDIKRRDFPKTAWKRIWRDPHFADLKA